MKKTLLFILLIVSISNANSVFQGKYMCNKKQILEITAENLYLGGATFKHNQVMDKPAVGKVKAFLKGNEAAIFSRQPNWEGHYSLNIRNLQNRNEPPYVADCTVIE